MIIPLFDHGIKRTLKDNLLSMEYYAPQETNFCLKT